jgi:hypothetical protein
MTTVLLKTLDEDGSAYFGGHGRWNLPTADGPGEWMPTLEGDLVPCKRGYHLFEAKDILRWIGPTLYVAEHDGEFVAGDDVIACRRTRLLYRVEGWTRRALGEWAADCAEHVLPFFEARFPDDDRPRTAIEAARAYWRGEIEAESAWSAAESAWSAAESAESAALAAWSAESAESWWSAAAAAWSAAQSAAKSAAAAAWSAESQSAARSAEAPWSASASARSAAAVLAAWSAESAESWWSAAAVESAWATAESAAAAESWWSAAWSAAESERDWQRDALLRRVGLVVEP